jgi:bifunctional non-homologous end joining protein LigD
MSSATQSNSIVEQVKGKYGAVAEAGLSSDHAGVRALCYVDGGSIRFESRNLLDITPRYPELQAMARALEGRRAILDGEIVALDEQDRPSFALLQERMHVKDAARVRRLMDSIPVYFFVFDLLWLDGQSLMDLPFLQRRERLTELSVAGPNWRLSPAYVGEGKQMLLAAEQNQLEGIMAKTIDSTYQPGRRSPDWIKIKIVQKQEFVIGGWTGEKDTDQGLGSLLLGYYDCSKPNKHVLRYAGRVGTGFNAAKRRDILKLLQPLERSASPFADPLPKPSRFARTDARIRFVNPTLIAEVEYRRWPPGGQIQQASFQGLRTDKSPTDVVIERLA